MLSPAHVRTQTLEEFCFDSLPQLADKTHRQTFLQDLAGCAVAPLLFISAAIKVETMCVHGTRDEQPVSNNRLKPVKTGKKHGPDCNQF